MKFNEFNENELGEINGGVGLTAVCVTLLLCGLGGVVTAAGIYSGYQEAASQ